MILYYIYLYIYILYISYCPCPLSKCINSRHFSQDCYAINRLKYLTQSQTTISYCIYKTFIYAFPMKYIHLIYIIE